MMDKRAGDVVEKMSAESTHAAANEAYRNEMEYVHDCLLIILY